MVDNIFYRSVSQHSSCLSEIKTDVEVFLFVQFYYLLSEVWCAYSYVSGRTASSKKLRAISSSDRYQMCFDIFSWDSWDCSIRKL